jgi:hypothetical protein
MENIINLLNSGFYGRSLISRDQNAGIFSLKASNKDGMMAPASLAITQTRVTISEIDNECIYTPSARNNTT